MTGSAAVQFATSVVSGRCRGLVWMCALMLAAVLLPSAGAQPAQKRRKRGRQPRPSRDGGRKARAAVTLIGLSATVGALVALGTAVMIYLIVLAIQQALS
ncbi:MAG: hypothetical protein KY395_02840 [Actinobacteria bacterium]|nr:hypothetical protein [Actinomycetota bacterium]